MNLPEKESTNARVCSLHLHPEIAGGPMRVVKSVEAIQGMGLQGDSRYYGRLARDTNKPSVRQISLIEREQIDTHARALGLKDIPAGAVRANIETDGLDLVALVGKRLRVGEAVLLVCEPREPCAKMDAICQGLRDLMRKNKQGVLAQVIESGRITEGDPIVPLAASSR